jgi:hypothetical protein
MRSNAELSKRYSLIFRSKKSMYYRWEYILRLLSLSLSPAVSSFAILFLSFACFSMDMTVIVRSLSPLSRKRSCHCQKVFNIVLMASSMRVRRRISCYRWYCRTTEKVSDIDVRCWYTMDKSRVYRWTLTRDARENSGDFFSCFQVTRNEIDLSLRWARVLTGGKLVVSLVSFVHWKKMMLV